ncbi:MAG TPA: chemotaxis protein CheW [Oligoflexus sp.]|uniref:chemotaxis protein CheW n=1 Tax=Oligoflexus sp. TaxID=1971216 RepID=UPI002D810251|nr:chemotaxis protein CheW [Oligoflexus sp.]HET9239726.1 chemotaxis protein CheW [Oligoflexus sp.]
MNKDRAPHEGQYLTFTLNQQLFGIPIQVVREINQLPEITPVPQAPEAVAGVINLRDKMIPVVDLRRKFDLPVQAYSRETCVIVVDGKQGQVAAIVDSVASVLPLSQAQIEAPPSLVQQSQSSPILGLARAGQQVIVLLNMAVLVDQDFIDEVTDLDSWKGRVTG